MTERTTHEIEKAREILEASSQSELLELIMRYHDLQADEAHLKRCEEELVAIRSLMLKPRDSIADYWLGDAVGNPSGITALAEARMEQIDTLQKQIDRIFELANTSDTTEPICRLLAPSVLGE